MKKILALVLAMALMISLVACKDNETDKIHTQVEQNVDNNEESNVTEENVEDNNTPDETPQGNKPPVNNETQKPAEKPNTQKPAEKPNTQKPAEKPNTQKPAEKPNTQKPADKPVETPQQQAPKTAGNVLLSDFSAKAGSYSDAHSLAEAVASNSIIPFATAAMAVEPGALSGFNSDITGFKEGAMFGPVIGSIPFVGYVFVLEDGADASAFVSTLKSNANLRWNICVEAEEMVVGSSGNKVFFVMTNKTFEE